MGGLSFEPLSRLSHVSVTLGVNLLAQSTLLLAGALVLTYSLRSKAAATQSTLLRVTLAALILCPLVSLALSAAGVNGVVLRLPLAAMGVAEAPAQPRSPAPVQRERETTLPPTAAPVGIPVLSENAPRPVDTTTPLVSVDNPGPGTLAILYLVLTAAWFAGCAALALRLLVAHVTMMRVRRRARCAPAAWSAFCETLARQMNLRPPALLSSHLVKSPCLVGCVHPAILLPKPWEADHAPVSDDILLHELAHLARHDCVWNLVVRATRAVLCYQPLVWWLARRIEDASDDVADDYVVQYGIDRRRYARQLVDIAARYQPSRSEAMAGAGVVAFRSSLGRRVQRILDSTRALSLRTRAGTAAVILTLGFCATLAAALVGAGGEDPGVMAPDPSVRPATLAGGGEVELVGVSTHPSTEHSWWRPDGQPLSEPPYDDSRNQLSPENGCRAYEFAVRFDALGTSHAGVCCETIPAAGSTGWDWPLKNKSSIADMRCLVASFPETLETCTLRCGMATGAWETLAEADRDQTGSSGSSTESAIVTFAEPVEVDGGTRITVTHNIRDRDVRVVAIGWAGKEHKSVKSDATGTGGWTQVSADYDVPLEQLRSFRLQARPFEWVVFSNVSLRPEENTPSAHPGETLVQLAETPGFDPGISEEVRRVLKRSQLQDGLVLDLRSARLVPSDESDAYLQWTRLAGDENEKTSGLSVGGIQIWTGPIWMYEPDAAGKSPAPGMPATDLWAITKAEDLPQPPGDAGDFIGPLGEPAGDLLPWPLPYPWAFRSDSGDVGIFEIADARDQDVYVRYKYLAFAAAPSGGAGREVPRVARLQLRWVAKEGDSEPTEELPVRAGAGIDSETLTVCKAVVLDESDLERAIVRPSEENGAFDVLAALKNEAQERFGQATGENVGRRMAVIFYGKVLSAPVVQSRISGALLVAAGEMSQSEAEAVAAAVNGTAEVGSANVHVVATRLDPIGSGRNTLTVEVRNLTDRAQVFATHIQTRSPNMGRRGMGWGTAYFDELPPNGTKSCRYAYTIHGQPDDDTWVRLRFSNPPSVDAYDFEDYFGEIKYFGSELEKRDLDSASVEPAPAELAEAITARFRSIQRLLEEERYQEVWDAFTLEQQQAGFHGQFSSFEDAMKQEAPSFTWARDDFLRLTPTGVELQDGRPVLRAMCGDTPWTLAFADEEGIWKVDLVAGYTPPVLLWGKWEERLLPQLERRSTPHFDVYYAKGSTAERDLDEIARQREAGYKAVCDVLGLEGILRVRLVFFENQDIKLKETGHQGAGMASGTTIVEVYNDAEQLDPYHEATHILAGTLGAPPALFIEGFAVYMSERLGAAPLKNLGGGERSLYERVRELKEAGEWIPLEELLTYTDIGPSESRPPVSYAEAGAFVKFLIDTYGDAPFLRAYADLKNSDEAAVHQGNRDALEYIYGKSLDALRDEWYAAFERQK